MASRWTFAIDRGGTFTDVIATSDDGEVRVEKLLSDEIEKSGPRLLELVSQPSA